MTPAEFDACFDRFRVSARKLETRRRYAVGGAEAERIREFEEGKPRSVRSVRTDPWLARIAVSTAAVGKSWHNIRIHDEPLTGYQQYGVASLVESQAAGVDVRIAQRRTIPDLDQDMWLFDAERLHELEAFALVMYYDVDDRYTGARLVTEAAALDLLLSRWNRALAVSVPLNEYLTASGKAYRAA